MRAAYRSLATDGLWRPCSWTRKEATAFCAIDAHASIGKIKFSKRAGRHQCVTGTPMRQARQVPKLVGPQEMVGVLGQGRAVEVLGIFMEPGMNNNYRTRINKWRIPTSLKQSIWVR